MKVKYNGETIGTITTNHSMSIDDALSIIGIDPNEMDGQDFKYDFELFEMEYWYKMCILYHARLHVLNM